MSLLAISPTPTLAVSPWTMPTTANVSAVGSWPSATAIAGFNGVDYQEHVSTTTTTDSFTWRMNLPTAGKYYLQVRWTAASTRASGAKYTATASDGTTTKVFSQRGGGNVWTNLGLKALNAPGQVTVKLDTASTGSVSSDAVRALPASIATKVNYIFADHLGTPRVITRNTDNQIIWRWDNADPFGLTPPNENPNALGAFKYNPRFPGQLYDAETGLYYNYHRNYNPGTGRYAQSDPIGLDGGINTYGYAGGNPVNNGYSTLLFVNPITIGVAEGIINTVGGLIVLIKANDIQNGNETPIPAPQPAPFPKWTPEEDEMHPHHDVVDDVCADPGSDCANIGLSIDILARDLWFRRWDYQRTNRDPFHIPPYNSRKMLLQELINKANSKGCPYNPKADEEVIKSIDYPTPSPAPLW